MKKTIVAISIVIGSALLLVASMFIYKQVNEDPLAAVKAHTIPYVQEEFLQGIPNDTEAYELDEDEYHQHLAQRWVDTFLSGQKDIVEYKLISIVPQVTTIENRDLMTYHIELEWTTRGKVKDYFSTQGIVNDKTNQLNFILRLKTDGGTIRYFDDMSMSTYEKAFITEQGSGGEDLRGKDTIKGLYDQSNNLLAVRETESDPWITTQVRSEDFSTTGRGWYHDDRRLYIKDDFIVILHSDEGVTLSISYDKGETWTKHKLLDLDSHLEYHTFGTIDFIDEVGYVVVKSSVAINADIATFHKTTDQGKTWVSGPIIDKNSHISAVKVLDKDTIFYVEKDSPHLYSTQDLGATVTQHTMEKTETIEGPYKDSQLEWEQVYQQAIAPYQEGSNYYLVLHQGALPDYTTESAIRYVSSDRGKTWKFFEHFIYIPEAKEEIN